MLVAFVLVAAYLGFTHVGSELMDPPPPPLRARSAPMVAPGSVTIAARNEDPRVPPQPAEH